MTLEDIGDALWPSPRPEALLNPESIFKRYKNKLLTLSTRDKPHLCSRLLEFSRYIFEQEEKRRLNIENKASFCLTATGILSALITGFSSLVFDYTASTFDFLFVIAFISFLLALLYFLRTSLLALRVFGRVMRSTLGPDEIIPDKDVDEAVYTEIVITRLIDYTINNYQINNKLLAQVWSAQFCLRNGIVLLTLGGTTLAIRMVIRPLLS